MHARFKSSRCNTASKSCGPAPRYISCGRWPLRSGLFFTMRPKFCQAIQKQSPVAVKSGNEFGRWQESNEASHLRHIQLRSVRSSHVQPCRHRCAHSGPGRVCVDLLESRNILHDADGPGYSTALCELFPAARDHRAALKSRQSLRELLNLKLRRERFYSQLP